jgi:hypothetical protein
MFCKELIEFQDKLYYVYRKYKESGIVEGKISDVKELWNCDIVIKEKAGNGDVLLFLKEIPELEIIQDSEVKVIENQ